MKNIFDYKGKQVLVLGLAKSGYTAAKLLHRLGAEVTVNDMASLDQDPHAAELKSMGVHIVDGGHPDYLIHENLYTIVKNPGIPYTNPLIASAMDKKVPVITEVELASQISEAEFIGITGSNGKTTTTMMLGEMMKGSEYEAIVAGNIGTVLSEVVQDATNNNIIVTELSSFQLLGTKDFSPHVAIILNLFEAHLDYHGTLQEYGRAKAKITANQKENDILIYNADNFHVVELIRDSKATKIPFSAAASTKKGAYIEMGAIYYKGEKIVHVDDMAMPGAHNAENALAAIAAAKVYNVSTGFLQKVLKTFSGVPHRLEFIKEKDGRLFYNDSKATNILATTKALAAFRQPTILLAGGLDRGGSFDALIPALDRVKSVVAFGETREKIKAAAEQAGVKTIKIADNVDEAVQQAYGLSDTGDVILLSPACASWDQYKSFEQRGDMFIKRVHML
ncbi:UDP-N-acetylmuramoylalanine--D-glutamate ligase [Scopulibacillus darangshiensis]|uniref:UDP-N-acetylmuramoylalanine--D-glutamate ligase n=1 Tax=Scopulibacillus darangshiensis TaxID=442528 RepID=A0A4R2P301_9BACL|nr:UDP-N-acetylmuramoyl-L-alanine--D-glutamate ligase [Scopulibacillus darangshiensis]TCP29090.1 UDP-N-acetylmuramoylalanine--D-glutamate ligase [Scopulibacillus darangshiensis]